MEKKRTIVDYGSMTHELLEALNRQYPFGYERNTVRFKNGKGETVTAVPVDLNESSYLVKISSKLHARLQSFLQEAEEEDAAVAKRSWKEAAEKEGNTTLDLALEEE